MMAYSNRDHLRLPGSLSASERLEKHKPDILTLWEKRARETLPAAQRFDPPALIDTLPDVLDRLIESLSHPKPRAAIQAAEKTLATGHGAERAFFDKYSLDQMISEYHILRRVLFEILDQGGPIRSHEREIITDTLFIATRNAAAEFTRIRESKQQDAQERLRESREDIAQKLIENATELAFSRELLYSIHLGVLDYAIFTLDTNGHITTWNRGATRMQQYSAEEAIGRHFSMLYPENARLRDEPMGHLSVAAAEGRFRGEGMRIKKSGEPFLADVLITPMYKEGTLFGFCKIVQDLTERNQLIQERDLSHTRITTMKVESDLRERFIYMLTHDLINPLTAAKAGMQLIGRTSCSVDKHQTLASRSQSSIERVERMITNLLDVSRLKAGEKLPITFNECDVTKVAEDVRDELISIHGDRFLLQSDPSIRGYWDCDGVRRMLENLGSNAAKYGDPSTPITLIIERAEQRAHLKVHNYGPVIDTEDQASLFQSFRRSKFAESSSKKGWGLGLTLVRAIAEAHGGVIKVESYPKLGTTFTVDLPIDPRTMKA